MTATSQALTRVFKFGAIELDDPDESLDAEKALAIHALAYPILKSSALAAPVVDGERLVYEVIKPQGKTKG